MPYASNAELPKQVRSLPSRGQTIWRKAFNAALKQYKDEERAFKVAWAAVKKVYKKIGDKWQLKTIQNTDIVFTDILEVKNVEGDYYVTGYLSTPHLDKVNDIVTWNALNSIAKQIKDSDMKFKIGKEHEHILEDSRNLPIAKIIDAVLDHKGLKITTKLNKYHPGFDIVKGSLEDGYLDAFSIEFNPITWRHDLLDGQKIRVIDELEFGGAAFTGRPANPECTITDVFIKSAAIDEVNEMDIKKKVTDFEATRKKMGMSVRAFYAIPRDPPSASKLPIYDAAHVRNAMARFNQLKGVSSAEKATARRKILRAAKKFGISITHFSEGKEMFLEYLIDKNLTEVGKMPKKEMKQEPETTEEKKPEEAQEETPQTEEAPAESTETEAPTEEAAAEETPAEEPAAEETPAETPAEESAEASVEEEVKSLAKDYVTELKSKIREEVKEALKAELKSLKPKSRVLVPKTEKFEKKSTPYSFMGAWKENKGVN